MNDHFFVYAHLNPETNKIFYVGKGKDNRAFDFKKRSKKWKEYRNSFNGEPKVLIVKNGISSDEASNLEQKLINRLGSDLTGGTLVNTDGIGFDPGISISISLGGDTSEDNQESKYIGWPDEEIIDDLLDFPNEDIVQTLDNRYEQLIHFAEERHNEIEEFDETISDNLTDIILNYQNAIVELQDSYLDKVEFNEIVQELIEEVRQVKADYDDGGNKSLDQVLIRLENDLKSSLVK